MVQPPNHGHGYGQWPAGTPQGPMGGAAGAQPGSPAQPGGPGAVPGPPINPPPSWAAWPNAPQGVQAGAPPKGAPLGLAIVSLVAMALAASIPFDSTMWWRTITAWAVFGVLACVALVLATAGAFGTAQQWTYSAIAAACVIATWVLIALPSVASNTGFAATVSALAAFGSVALLPGRRI